MQDEASYIKKVRRMIQVIKDQLIGLQELQKVVDLDSKQFEQLSEFIVHLQKQEAHFASILRSHVGRKIKKTIQEFNKELEAKKKPVLKLVK